MKTFKCPFTGKELTYTSSTVFRVYVRRSNCKKRLVHVSQDPEKAMDAFNKIRVYQNDKKYLHTDNTMTYRENGYLTRETGQNGTKFPSNYQYKPFNCPRVPVTILHTLSGHCGKAIDDGTYTLSLNRIGLLLLARASEMSETELFSFLNGSLPALRRNMVLSGCDNSEEIVSVFSEDLL